jgi:DNA-binding transcriptional ArsR family regulator
MTPTDHDDDFDPAVDVRPDAVGVRALAHPLRVRLLGRLRLYGPATASQLARAVGESSGATSYHLRRLHLHGFIVEDEERGSGRERWWRAAHRTTQFDMGGDADLSGPGGDYLRAVAQNYSARMLAYAGVVETVAERYGQDWADACTMSDWKLELTAEQAAELHREVFALMRRYRDLPESADTRTLLAQVQLFPPAEL